jgi:hypothetical protein
VAKEMTKRYFARWGIMAREGVPLIKERDMRNSAPTNQVDQIHLDVIDIASLQSFPASDPPAWAGGQVHGASPAEASPVSKNRSNHACGDEQGRGLPVLDSAHLLDDK